MKNVPLKSTRGFTLIELLVVIGIIGILSAVVYASFGDARKLSRDQIRKTAVKEMQLAIELYKAQNGTYPDRCPSSSSWSGSVNGTFKCSDPNDDYIIGLVPDFIAALPVDPTTQAANNGYIYRVNANRDQYKFMSNNAVEIDLVNSYEDEFARCSSPQPQPQAPYCPPGASPQAVRSYAVYSAGAVGW